ncbi:hypothetical protein I79_022760 [Cricetulus griseus]|uniref:Uncharacterized protein n=1 Tax=Cricetulus griseus TaxID=10029 RepID=G3IG79_CRIGR|nr:hypothetical protein I79_022760 [Cricetulus griseus]
MKLLYSAIYRNYGRWKYELTNHRSQSPKYRVGANKMIPSSPVPERNHADEGRT